MRDIAEHLPITEGTDRLMSVLKTCGYKIAILSGGFTFFGEYLQRRYGIDYVYANELEVGEDVKLTGRYVGEIVDGANDLPMLMEAGLGIAFHAKPRVKESARQSLSTIGLDGVLYFLGFKDSLLGEQGRM